MEFTQKIEFSRIHGVYSETKHGFYPKTHGLYSERLIYSKTWSLLENMLRKQLNFSFRKQIPKNVTVL